MERRVKVPNPITNEMIEGFDVPIEEALERWSEFKLEDGTVIRVRMNVISVIRIPDTYDATGGPVYVMNGAPTMAIVNVPDNLRKKVQ
jgi:hypothetical protein